MNWAFPRGMASIPHQATKSQRDMEGGGVSMTYGSCSDTPRRSCMPTAMANEDPPDSRIAVVSTSTDAAAAAAVAAADVAGAAGRSSRENATPFDNGASKRSGGDIVMRKSDKMAMVRLTVAILPWLRPSTRVLVARIPFERQAAMR